MRRMIDDYNERFYSKLFKRSQKINAENYKLAGEISNWKEKIKDEWEKIELISAEMTEFSVGTLVPGQRYSGKLILNINGLSSDDLGVEFVISESNLSGKLVVTKVIELKLGKLEGSSAYFNIEFSPSKPGSLNYAFRVFPKNPFLAHRQDCTIVKWL